MLRMLALVLGLLGALVPAWALALEPTVIVLSFDGVRHDYLARDAENLPALSRLAREGAQAEHLVPVFPSSTFPNHVSLATGTYPDRHGIVANRFTDPSRSPEDREFDYANDATWIQAEPIWVAAERQGIRAASFFWVGSETAWPDADGIAASYRRAPFAGSVPESEKTDQILAWLDLPQPKRPRLILSWWHGADAAGHRFGPDTAQARGQLAGQDAELARLLAGLDARAAWGQTTLLVVSDHGMTVVTERIDPAPALKEAGIRARTVYAGSVAHLFLERPGADLERARAALKALPGVRVYARAELPAHLRYDHPTRTGHLLVLTDPPRALAAGGVLQKLFKRPRGAHGYEPARFPEMNAILLAHGRGVEKGRALGPVRAIDVAPTVAVLLGIEPPRHSEGTPIRLAR